MATTPYTDDFERTSVNSWMYYYYQNVRDIPTSGKAGAGYGYGVTNRTLFGAAAVYDEGGNLLALDDNIRSGGGTLPGEGSNIQQDKHVEKRAIDWFDRQGKLHPPNTLVIAVNKEGAPPCSRGKSCDAAMARVAEQKASRSGMICSSYARTIDP